jgi:hypothetical protein
MAKQETEQNVGSALLAAQSAIKSVGKDSTNAFHKYAYASADGMITACREVLHAAGLVAFRASWKLVSEQRSYTDDKGQPQTETLDFVLSTFALLHPASNTRMDSADLPWPALMEKGRPLDKAIAGALTTSLSYWLRDTLQVPREDEAEIDRRDDTQYQPRRTTEVRKPAHQTNSAAAGVPASSFPKQGVTDGVFAKSQERGEHWAVLVQKTEFGDQWMRCTKSLGQAAAKTGTARMEIEFTSTGGVFDLVAFRPSQPRVEREEGSLV